MSQSDVMPLAAQEAEALEAVGKAVDDARAELGEAYLRFEESRVAFERTRDRLEKAVVHARYAETQHEATMKGISQVLQLPPGEWIYDRSRTRLVRKGADDA